MKERRIIDITGIKKGNLTAIKFVKRENRRTFWLYICDCGTQLIKASRDVDGIRTKSCGCLNKTRIDNLVSLMQSRRLPNSQVCKNRLYRMYKKQALKRNLNFLLSIKEFEFFLDKNCEYCGIGPSNTMKEGKFGLLKYNGIDRKINSLGYTMENCAPSCYKCNKMKMNLNKLEFTDQITRIFKWITK